MGHKYELPMRIFDTSVLVSVEVWGVDDDAARLDDLSPAGDVAALENLAEQPLHVEIGAIWPVDAEQPDDDLRQRVLLDFHVHGRVRELAFRAEHLELIRRREKQYREGSKA